MLPLVASGAKVPVLVTFAPPQLSALLSKELLRLSALSLPVLLPLIVVPAHQPLSVLLPHRAFGVRAILVMSVSRLRTIAILVILLTTALSLTLALASTAILATMLRTALMVKLALSAVMVTLVPASPMMVPLAIEELLP